MLLVQVRYKRSKITELTVGSLGYNLQKVIASALTEPDSDEPFEPEDVVVWVNEVGPLDRQSKDVGIVIHAYDLPSLEPSFFDRADVAIAREVRVTLGEEQSYFIRLILCKGGYIENAD